MGASVLKSYEHPITILLKCYVNATEAANESTPRGRRKAAEALAEVMTEGAFINGALIGISENRHIGVDVRVRRVFESFHGTRENTSGKFRGYPQSCYPESRSRLSQRVLNQGRVNLNIQT